MNPITLWNVEDQILVLSVNVLVQVTVVTGVALAVAAAARRNPSARYGVLWTSLLLVLMSPVLALVMQSSGYGLFSVSLTEATLASNSSDTLETPNSGNPVAVASPPAAPRSPIPTPRAGEEFPIVAFEPGNAFTGSGGPIERTSPAPLADATPALEGRTGTESGSLLMATPLGNLLRAVMPPLLLIWIGGTVCLLIRLAIAWWRLAMLLRAAQRVMVPSWIAILQQVRLDLRLTRAPELVQSSRISGPVSTGLFRPRIVLPEWMVERVTDEQLRTILIHESAHVLRRDQLGVMMQNFCSAIFWLHPLVRTMNRRLSLAREEICDNYVLAAAEAPSYCRTLLDFAQLIPSPDSVPGAVGLFTSRWRLDQRVADLLDEGRSRMTSLTMRGRTLVIALAAMMLTVAAYGTMTLAVGEIDAVVDLASERFVVSAVDDEGEAEATSPDSTESRHRDNAADAATGTPLVDVTGVVHERGQPVVGAIVQAHYTGFMGTGWRAFTTGETATDADGRFTIPMPRRRISEIKIVARTDESQRMALASTSHTMDPEGADVRSSLEDPVRLKDFELQLESSLRREVRVVGPDGDPIAAATVGLILHSEWDFATATTDGDGIAVMHVPADCDHYEFFAWQSGFAVDFALGGTNWRGRRLPLVNSDSPITLTLENASPVTVRVLDAVTNEPVPDVAVRVEIPDKESLRTSFAGGTLGYGLSAITDSQGQATVNWLPPWVTTGVLPDWVRQESLRVWARHPGYTYARTDLQFNDREDLLTLKVIPDFRLHGRVVHADGRPAAGVVVASWTRRSIPFDQTVTDDEGRYELAAPPDLGTIVSVMDDEWAAVPRSEFDIQRPGTTANVADMVLQPAKRVHGRVTAAEGNRPVVGQFINLHLFGPPRGDGLWGEGPPTRIEQPHTTLTTWTDETGHYEFRVGPGDYKISGPGELESADGVLFARRSSYWSLNIAEDSESRRHDFTASIWTGGTEPDERPAPERAENDADRGQPGNDAAANAPDAARNHRVVAGRVIEDNGNPVGGATVLLPVNLGLALQDQARDVVQTITGVTGAFRMEVPAEWLEPPLRQHQTTLWVYKSGFGLGTADVANQLEHNDPGDAVEISLPPEANPEFQILDETGTPASNVLVEPQNYREPRGYGIVPRELLQHIAAETDNEGRITIRGMEQGKLFNLLVRSVRHGTQEFRVDTLPDGGELQLREAVSLSGRVIRGEPAWRQGIRVSFTTERPRRITADTPPQFGFTDGVGTATVTTDAAGRFEVPLIATGNLSIQEALDPQLPVRLLLPERAVVPIDGDLVLPLEPAIIVRGHVVREDGADPVAGVTVSVRYGQFRQGDRAITDENGEFESGVLPGRVYQQVLSIPDSDLTYVGSGISERFEVPITDEVFELPVIELVGTWRQPGRLVDADGEPLANYDIWGVNGNRRYGFAKTNDQGEFEMQLPNGIEMEKYGYNTPDDVLGRATILDTEPLMLLAE